MPPMSARGSSRGVDGVSAATGGASSPRPGDEEAAPEPDLPIGVASSGDTMARALRAACTELDGELLAHCKKYDVGDGSTGTAVVFMRDPAGAAGDEAGLLSTAKAPLRVWCANVGDTRAVLSRGGIAVELSKDHGTDDPEEVARVHSVGGAIKQRRLQGILAVTRAFGDMELKVDYDGRYVEELTGPPLIAMPDVVRRTIDAERPEDEAEVVEDDDDPDELDRVGRDARDSSASARDQELGVDLTAGRVSRGRDSSLSGEKIGPTEDRDESNFDLLSSRADDKGAAGAAMASRSKESDGADRGVLDAWRTATGSDEFVIIACDGLWDVMSSQQAVNFVRRQLAEHGDLVRAANELVQKSLELFTIDNVTAIIVGFMREGAGEPAVAGDSLMTV